MFHLKIITNASWEDVEDNCPGNVILADHENNDDVENLAEIIGDDVVKAENYEEDPEAFFDNNDEEVDNENIKKKLRAIYELPMKSYYDINYSDDKSYVIIIGGETHGLSEDSFKFASSRNGIRLNIPTTPFVNSLNSATALGIISFEIKRQLDIIARTYK